jgi:hypothetical protein
MMTSRSCARAAIWCSLFGILLLSRTALPESLPNAQPVLAPGMDLPDYLVPAVDSSLGTTFVRVTTPKSPLGNGVACNLSYCTHRYSSAQAWNADQSLLLIVNGCNGLCFLDGHTHAPLFQRQRGGECEWHPQDPDLMICIAGRRISRWAPRHNTEELILETAAYRELQFGPYKGNPSWDGNRIVVRAKSEAGALVAFAFDLSRRQKFPDVDLARLPGKNNYCGISPLGRYIFCQQSLFDLTDQAFVFTIEGNLVQSWTEHHRPGHGDMTVDTDGQEVYVGISKSAPDKYQVIKRRLQDGLVTALAPYGDAQHASMRAIRRPGWVFLSYAGNPLALTGRSGVAPFAQEVVALKIDGSGAFRRIAHTVNTPYDYWSETHASPSPDGSQIIWSSNWGKRGGPVFDFVSRVDWADWDNRQGLMQGDRHERQSSQ